MLFFATAILDISVSGCGTRPHPLISIIVLFTQPHRIHRFGFRPFISLPSLESHFWFIGGLLRGFTRILKDNLVPLPRIPWMIRWTNVAPGSMCPCLLRIAFSAAVLWCVAMVSQSGSCRASMNITGRVSWYVPVQNSAIPFPFYHGHAKLTQPRLGNACPARLRLGGTIAPTVTIHGPPMAISSTHRTTPRKHWCAASHPARPSWARPS